MKKIAIALLLLAGASVSVAYASNSWGKNHWDISTAESVENPLVLRDNLTTLAWDASLASASADWNASVLKNQVVEGTNTACNPVLGSVEVCNNAYGENNWLGIAQIWVYRGKAGHIAQALVKVNDTYFVRPEYNTIAWRNSVMCQEVGHTYGLEHQDEVFDNSNLGTCMDYTNDPDGTVFGQADNQHPNQHDYDTLEEKYAHLNETSTGVPGNGKGGGKKNNKPAGVGSDIDLNNPSSWGQAVRQDAQGKNSLYERNLGNGQTLFTYVIWAD
jgi:hypothetical protein